MENITPCLKLKKTFSILSIALITILILFNFSPIVQGTPPSSTPPAGSIMPNATSNTTGEIIFGKFLPEPDYYDIRVLVRINGTASGYLNFPETNGTMVWVGGPDNVTASYYGLNIEDKNIHEGDYIEFIGLFPSTLYTFGIYYIPQGEVCTLVGINYFGTPPEPPTPLEVTNSGEWPPIEWDYSESNNDENTMENMILLLTIIALFVSIILISYHFGKDKN